MRINRYLALATGMSRRAADEVIDSGQVIVNGQTAKNGAIVSQGDKITLDGKIVNKTPDLILIGLNKPVGYVCSRDGQGSKTIYDLLPAEFHHLKPVGRLDKDSSGLLLLTNNGKLAHELTHPSFAKQKIYEISLDKVLDDSDRRQIETGVQLDDGLSKLHLQGAAKDWTVIMNEGRNRQIRRTFAILNYKVQKLHRTQFGPYDLKNLPKGSYQLYSPTSSQ